MRTSKPTAIFGGSFDPPHCGHVMVVAWLLTCTRHKEVLIIPCYKHAFGKASAPFEDRLAMCRIAFRAFGRRVQVLDVEARLPTPSYTVQTLRYLSETMPDRSFTLVVGSDVAYELPRWKEPEELKKLANILVVRRQGFEEHEGAIGPPFPAVSSSEVRRLLGKGESPQGFVPVGVLDYIKRHRLYAED